MGKMKITKNKKNSTKSKNFWMTVIIVVVLAAVLISSLATVISSTGLLKRSFSAMKSEDYKVNGNMMAYFYANTYSSFASTYSSYLSMFSLGQNSSIEDHSKIVIGGTTEKPNTTDTVYFSSYKGKTWFDMFMDQTKESVKSMLVYCEEADAIGVKLDADDKKNIETSIDNAILQFKINMMAQGGASNISESTCLTLMYGTGMSRSDVRKAMELSVLATKCAEKIQDTLEAAITDGRMDKEYTDNKLDYDAIDYFYFRYSVDYDDIVEEVAGKKATDDQIKEKKDEILAKYKAEIEAAKKLADGLEACKTLDEFKAYVINNKVSDTYDDLFEAEDFKSEDKPTEEDLKIIKEKLTSAVAKEVLEGAKETVLDDVQEKTAEDKTKTYTAYGFTVKEKFAKSIKEIRTDLFSNLKNTLETYTIEKGSYNKNDDFSKWAFEADRKDGDIKVIAEGDGSKEGELKVEKEYYRETVYLLTKKQYKDEEMSRDVAYALFSSTTSAQKLIDALKEETKDGKELTVEKFEELAGKQSASGNAQVENYIKGQMGSSAFDQWLYDAELKKGAYSDSPITMSDDSIMVAFYMGEGDMPSWKVNVKNAILEEDYTAREDKMTAKHSGSVKTYNWVVNLVA